MSSPYNETVLTGIDFSAATDEDVAFELAERAAILQFDNGLSREAADQQALDEYLARTGLDALPLPGIYGELDRAAKRRNEPLFQDVSGRLKLDRTAVDPWGWAYVKVKGPVYRPAPSDPEGHVAIIAPCFDLCGDLIDLVAHGLRTGRQATRLGAAEILGLEAVEIAKETGGPLFVYRDAYMWLVGHGLGAVVLDWVSVPDTLSGVATMLCHRDTAPTLYAATRDCWPIPEIAVYTPKEARNAA